MIKKRTISTSELIIYSDIIVKNASYILGLKDTVNSLKDIDKLHSIIEMDITVGEIEKYVDIKYVKKVYKYIERKIMNGQLQNDNKSIKEFLNKMNIKEILKETNYE